MRTLGGWSNHSLDSFHIYFLVPTSTSSCVPTSSLLHEADCCLIWEAVQCGRDITQTLESRTPGLHTLLPYYHLQSWESHSYPSYKREITVPTLHSYHRVIHPIYRTPVLNTFINLTDTHNNIFMSSSPY